MNRNLNSGQARLPMAAIVGRKQGQANSARAALAPGRYKGAVKGSSGGRSKDGRSRAESAVTGPQTPARDFRPDLECYVASAICAGVGVAVLGVGVVAGHAAVGSVLASGAALAAYRRYRDGRARGRGFAVEAQTLAELQEQCDARGWALKTDLWFDGVGNVDAMVQTDGLDCILEIKSYGGLRVQGGLVVRCNREHTPAARELRQAQRQAQRVRGAMGLQAASGISAVPVMPVLWCPKAPREAGVVHEGVLLANGSTALMAEIIAELGARMGSVPGPVSARG